MKPPGQGDDRPVRPPSPALIEALRAAVGAEGWSDDPDILAPLLEEPRGLWTGRTPLLLRPGTTGQVSRILALCAEHGAAVVPQGGNTGLVGGSLPRPEGDEILLSLARMNRVRAVDPANDTITVEAGCILADIQAAAGGVDRLFPLSLGAEGSCRIGGNLSTNAGGTAVLRYGSARDLALGLEVVLPDGRVWDGLRALRKDNAGYDLKQLFIGAEGTLGVITAAVLRLFPRPRDRACALVAVADPAAAVALLARARAAVGEAVTACELMPRIGIDMALANTPGARDPFDRPSPWTVLLELSSARRPPAGLPGLAGDLEALLAAAHDDGAIADAIPAASEAQARSFWLLREAIPLSQKSAGGSIKHDVAVPVSRIAEFIELADRAVAAALPGVRPVAFGHLGDGNIHYNLSQPTGADREAFLDRWQEMNRIVHDIVAGLGGSFSAEHGIGRLKRGELRRYRSATELDLMRTLKAAFDPAGIMNPGRIL